MKKQIRMLLAAMLTFSLVLGSTGQASVFAQTGEEVSAEAEEEVDVQAEDEITSEAVDEAVVEDDESSLPDGVAGMPAGYELSEAEVRIKNDMIENDVLTELGKMTSGVDYSEDEVICFAYNEEHARRIAEAYSGELLEYSYGVAKISLAGSVLDVEDAVRYGLDRTLGLPAVEPNYIYDLIELQDPEPEERPDGDELLSDDYRSDWDRVFNGMLTNPDPMLHPGSEKYQWHHQAINTYNAWNVTTGSPEITVAVIDSGYTPGHPDVDPVRVVTSDLDVFGNGNVDDQGHGTHVMGIIGAGLDNGKGGAGVAPLAKLLPVKVLDENGRGNDYDICRGILYVAGFSSSGYDFGPGKTEEEKYNDYFDQNGNPKGMTKGARKADIINMSLGGESDSALKRQAVKLAYDQGVTTVAAMGNSAGSVKAYPAGCDHVISVSAISYDGRPTSFSSLGSWADVAAPGYIIYSTTYDNGYGRMSGTSQASPIVAGACALYMSKFGHTDPDKMETVIRESTNKAPVSGMGAGVLDLSKMFDGVEASPAIREEELVLVPADPSLVSEIKITGQNYIARKGNATFKAVVGPKTAKNKKVSWSLVTEGAGVNITVGGKVTVSETAALGKYTVRATAVDAGGCYCDHTFEVVPAKMTGLAIDADTSADDKPNYKIVRKNGKLTSLQLFDYNITAPDRTDNGTDETSIELKAVMTGAQNGVEWTSQNPDIAAIEPVSDNGSCVVVKGIKPGKVKITCTASDGSGKKATISVSVVTPVSSIKVNIIDQDFLLAEGKSAKLATTVEQVYGKATNTKVIWDYDLFTVAGITEFQSGKFAPITDPDILAEIKKDGLYKVSKGKVTVDKNFWSKYRNKYSKALNDAIPVIRVNASADDGSGAIGSEYLYPVIGSRSVDFFEEYLWSWKKTSKKTVSLNDGVGYVVIGETKGRLFYVPGPYDGVTGKTYAQATYKIVSSNDKVATGNIVLDGDFLYLGIYAQSKGTAKFTLISQDGTNIKKTLTVKVK